MSRGENLDSIPTDLILEIFSRLSAKSIGRCRCVSKLWKSMLGRPNFTELFLTRSSDHPRLLFGVKREGEWLFFSSPQCQNIFGKSSLLVTADFHMKFSQDLGRTNCSYVSGLIYFPSMQMCEFRVICNPITGKYAILQRITYKEVRSFLGFDPIDKQFKVLRINHKYYKNGYVHHILTLGPGKMRWRKIHCPLAHVPFREEICVNGVLYYLAHPTDHGAYVICCFDVRSEKFKFIDTNCFCGLPELIRYKGKLGAIIWKYDTVSGRCTVELCMWVLEDVEKQEWSKYVHPLPENSYYYSVAGVTAKGDIVFVKKLTSKPFYVFYVNPERKTFQRVEIHGNHEVFDSKNLVYAFVDHVEDLKFDVMKKTYAATYISPPEQKPKPTCTETSSREDHQGWTSTSSKKDHQVRTIAYQQQFRPTFESINKFNALYLDDDDEITVAQPQQDLRTLGGISKFKAQRLLDDDEFTGVKTSKCDTSPLQNRITAVHELHVWSITVDKVSLASHVRINYPEVDTNAVIDKVIKCIKREHKINHVTIQVE
ncbi:LOW QUALITY PROTEIN: putative F-box protein At1g33020 [Arabidopsis lyrata subsp. lyrata]|uniref:LOW QUALITY PROTEIN: putative F-box protein At1g33020 n=1 Tax=Arabidopsis lyrata subsp. lyrata TaxID=81972 RepID=UPI000A29A9B1|nr:LOW QUALITY PROTEIN: putative F-box protein At1g33020 [Arabidopsis lyrata subsp. lyrata]|eukprot:XP_020866613.1 LOW QUALITY PROTEIN: putative F-box protein At1g33020 [Arabidopsis lyrata subsp. lyrata]